MATYASVDDLNSYGVGRTTLDAEELLRRAEADIDVVIGPLAILSTGRKLDPLVLSSTQRSALTRATCAQAGFRAEQGESAMAETDDYLPAEVTPYRRAGAVSRQALTELSGQGLIVFSGTVSTT